MSKFEGFKELLSDLRKEQEQAVDFNVRLKSLRMTEDGLVHSTEDSRLRNAPMTDFAQTQIFHWSDIPVRFGKKMLEERPDTVADQFNHLIAKSEDKNMLVRAFERDGHLITRGFLTDKYTKMDNIDVIEAFTDVLTDLPEMEIQNKILDDRRMHLRIVFPETDRDLGIAEEGDPNKGDIVRVGVDVQNSEVGYSSLIITPVTYRLVCSNGMKTWNREEDVFRKKHMSIDREIFGETLKLAFRDSIIKGKGLIDQMSQAREDKVDDIDDYVNKMVLEYNLSKKMGERIKDNYAFEPQKSVYGVVNAVTRTARDIENVDSRLMLEEKAGMLLAK